MMLPNICHFIALRNLLNIKQQSNKFYFWSCVSQGTSEYLQKQVTYNHNQHRFKKKDVLIKIQIQNMPEIVLTILDSGL